MIPEMQKALNRLERKTTDHEEGLKILRDELRKLRAELGLSQDKPCPLPADYNLPDEAPTKGISKWGI